MRRAVPVFLTCFVLACGSDANPGGSVDAPPGGGGDGGGGGGGDGGGGGTDGGGGGGWQTLVSGEWTLPVNDEGYVCVRKTLTETMFVRAFRPVIPVGTHHTVLTIGDPGGPDETFPCSTATNSEAMIFGSGVGTDELLMPDGVAFRLQAGQQLLLNLHVYNESQTTPLSGISGTEVLLISESEVMNEAEVLLAGTFAVYLPDGQTTTINGGCRMNGDVTIFATGPHMHRLGTHMTVIAETASGDLTIMDRDYSFDEQTVELVGNVPVPAGNNVRVACTYYNNTGDLVTWGESSDQEMCFASLFRYPKQGAGVVCTN